MVEGVDQEFINAIVAAEIRRNAEHQAALAQRRQALRAEAQCLVPELLSCDPGLTRIRLIGSVLPNRALHLDSDLDIAVEGATRFSQLLRIVEASGWPVDLIEWETLHPAIQDVIARDAEVLYASR
ncbi:MAG: hypothetical protein EA428_02600 [Spirochaetaceae bacterium]|nr:MAG: hypothetical protein EA428_02600 [Spirochaetaceae bacterium]